MSGKRFSVRKLIEELILLAATILILSPVFYLLIGAFKGRNDIVRYPFVINREMFILSNFPKAIKNM